MVHSILYWFVFHEVKAFQCWLWSNRLVDSQHLKLFITTPRTSTLERRRPSLCETRCVSLITSTNIRKNVKIYIWKAPIGNGKGPAGTMCSSVGSQLFWKRKLETFIFNPGPSSWYYLGGSPWDRTSKSRYLWEATSSNNVAALLSVKWWPVVCISG